MDSILLTVALLCQAGADGATYTQMKQKRCFAKLVDCVVERGNTYEVSTGYGLKILRECMKLEARDQ